MPRYRNRRASGRRPRRQLCWARFVVADTPAVSTTASLSPLADFETDCGGADLVGWTILRVIGDGLVCQTADAAAEKQHSFYQALYVSEAATTVALTPGGADNVDYLWFKACHLYTVGAIAVPTSPSSCERFHFDVRGRRRFREPLESLRLTWTNPDADDTLSRHLSLSILLAR